MTFAGRREMCKADMGSVFKNRNTACRTFAQIMSLVTKMYYLEFLTGLPRLIVLSGDMQSAKDDAYVGIHFASSRVTILPQCIDIWPHMHELEPHISIIIVVKQKLAASRYNLPCQLIILPVVPLPNRCEKHLVRWETFQLPNTHSTWSGRRNEQANDLNGRLVGKENLDARFASHSETECSVTVSSDGRWCMCLKVAVRFTVIGGLGHKAAAVKIG